MITKYKLTSVNWKHESMCFLCHFWGEFGYTSEITLNFIGDTDVHLLILRTFY